MAAPQNTAAASPTIAQLIGQKLVVAMSGTTPDADLLGRVTRGEVGGVILFGPNITDARTLRALTAQLDAAAARGGQPKLLIVTDQEGGAVKRVPWAPPTLSAPAMGSLGSTATARTQGDDTGYVLRCAGINGDLAPVADVPASTASFMEQQGRTWSFSASTTASLSDAFAAGLADGGSIAAMKHFPGLGLATRNTDTSVVTITAPKSALAPGLLPYEGAIGQGIPLVMLSNATYTAYDSANAAGSSHAISVGLLRDTLGFTGVSITDSLTGTATARGVTPTSLAIKAAQAGTDMLLLTGTEASTKATFTSLVAAASAGTIPIATLQASYDRILHLKSTVSPPVADAAAPSVVAPTARLYSPATLGTTTVPVRTAWSAADPCGVSGYSVERKVGGGAWTAQGLASPTATSLAQSLAFGSVDQYAARAADGAGNASGWAYGASVMPILRESSSAYVATSGSWWTAGNTGYSGGSTRFATTPGASASYTFTGSGVAWVAAVGSARGSARVYLDGTYYATVSLYATTTALRRIVYAANWGSQGTHTIRIVVVGTAGHPRVDVDAFVRLYRP
jgi:beta-N-acetylhexosaminidase